ncbi:hypothetical protein [Mycobacteroides immunogenum]|uniref:Secreted protein n=1 Tax=Mycobacteroides immunogenum TaxID=83262 RepID=A0A7V8LQC8_9MYCO|nr:hypothetical protein [Mycobacteroides immunogenum]AMT69367.1 hypothetical protein ABG82_02390 [Mycobacteroides immunogenum]ANO02404.1 hypothetical protein BAB75_02390 [Mycobacteroides immunogenum]KIU39627.1 hypothetical protein TL11_16100 [Mycobacteroides immunogenum]KPG08518.1 hypothetical protein AN909_14470 [Mycobacteroides immunogenum]KPG08770.1 hypothetical protein AN910_17775 [Mycobacteroides immunogenum]
MRKPLALAAGALAVGGLLGVPVSAVAEPAKSPYPDIGRYTKIDFEGYRLPSSDDDFWFSTPTGLNCGIWADGSFGCTGSIPGAPSGTNQIGWFTGDSQPHFDQTQQPRFINPGGLPQRVIPRNNYIAVTQATGYGDTTTCAITDSGGVYCFKSGTWKGAGGAYAAVQFIVSPSVTYIGEAPTS